MRSPLESETAFHICPVCKSRLPVEAEPIFDVAMSTIRWNGRVIRTGQLRVRILQKLWEHRGTTVHREILWALIQERSVRKAGASEALLRTHITNLRRMLEKFDVPFKISNDHCAGYTILSKPK